MIKQLKSLNKSKLDLDMTDIPDELSDKINEIIDAVNQLTLKSMSLHDRQENSGQQPTMRKFYKCQICNEIFTSDSGEFDLVNRTCKHFSNRRDIFHNQNLPKTYD